KLIGVALLSTASAATWLLPAPSAAQTETPAAATEEDAPARPDYKPPARGAPGGRVGGASRGTVKVTAPLPTIELLAPDGHAGQTISPAPTLYFSVSRATIWPTQFTIISPLHIKPVIDAIIPPHP